MDQSSHFPVKTKTKPRPFPVKTRAIPRPRRKGKRPTPLLNKSDSAAVKIQKVFRGFLVRKSVRKINEISNEINELEKYLVTEKFIELMRNDSKERVKVSEMIMRLLLRLDSVRGVDYGVRELRRAVIKRAIRLQEFVDSVANKMGNCDDEMQKLSKMKIC